MTTEINNFTSYIDGLFSHLSTTLKVEHTVLMDAVNSYRHIYNCSVASSGEEVACSVSQEDTKKTKKSTKTDNTCVFQVKSGENKGKVCGKSAKVQVGDEWFCGSSAQGHAKSALAVASTKEQTSKTDDGPKNTRTIEKKTLPEKKVADADVQSKNKAEALSKKSTSTSKASVSGSDKKVDLVKKGKYMVTADNDFIVEDNVVTGVLEDDEEVRQLTDSEVKIATSKGFTVKHPSSQSSSDTKKDTKTHTKKEDSKNVSKDTKSTKEDTPKKELPKPKVSQKQEEVKSTKTKDEPKKEETKSTKVSKDKVESKSTESTSKSKSTKDEPVKVKKVPVKEPSEEVEEEVDEEINLGSDKDVGEEGESGAEDGVEESESEADEDSDGDESEASEQSD